MDHNIGSGKTLLMLRIVDNYYFDKRPRIVIFPKDVVCDNFDISLLEWPTRWRDYFASQCPTEASIAANCMDWRQRREKVWDLTLQNTSLKKVVDSEGKTLRVCCTIYKEIARGRHKLFNNKRLSTLKETIATRGTEQMLARFKRKREDEDHTAWHAVLTTVAKFPRKGMQGIIQQEHPSLDNARFTALRVVDKAIVPHMFEFDYGLSPAFEWPQGPCHRHGIFEKVPLTFDLFVMWTSLTNSQSRFLDEKRT